MSNIQKENLIVKGIEVIYKKVNEEDYICLTDIAKSKNNKKSDKIIENWMRNRMTIEYLGLWETLYNKDFNPSNLRGLKKWRD